MPEILECHLMSGQFDYLLRVAAAMRPTMNASTARAFRGFPASSASSPRWRCAPSRPGQAIPCEILRRRSMCSMKSPAPITIAAPLHVQSIGKVAEEPPRTAPPRTWRNIRTAPRSLLPRTCRRERTHALRRRQARPENSRAGSLQLGHTRAEIRKPRLLWPSPAKPACLNDQAQRGRQEKNRPCSAGRR